MPPRLQIKIINSNVSNSIYMKNILKILLTKNDNYKYSNVYNTQVLDNRSITITDIIDEMQKEGLDVDREVALTIVTRFNKKVTQEVFSGKNVNTGLVNISPIIKGSLNEKRWNPRANRVEIDLKIGEDLTNALSDTVLELVDEKSKIVETYDLLNQVNQAPEPSIINEEKKVDFGDIKLNINEDPACGIAFRTWLWKS
jgi:hypothetical protein